MESNTIFDTIFNANETKISGYINELTKSISCIDAPKISEDVVNDLVKDLPSIIDGKYEDFAVDVFSDLLGSILFPDNKPTDTVTKTLDKITKELKKIKEEEDLIEKQLLYLLNQVNNIQFSQNYGTIDDAVKTILSEIDYINSSIITANNYNDICETCIRKIMQSMDTIYFACIGTGNPQDVTSLPIAIISKILKINELPNSTSQVLLSNTNFYLPVQYYYNFLQSNLSLGLQVLIRIRIIQSALSNSSGDDVNYKNYLKSANDLNLEWSFCISEAHDKSKNGKFVQVRDSFVSALSPYCNGFKNLFGKLPLSYVTYLLPLTYTEADFFYNHKTNLLIYGTLTYNIRDWFANNVINQQITKVDARNITSKTPYLQLLLRFPSINELNNLSQQGSGPEQYDFKQFLFDQGMNDDASSYPINAKQGLPESYTIWVCDNMGQMWNGYPDFSWNQDVECQFIPNTSNYLPYDFNGNLVNYFSSKVWESPKVDSTLGMNNYGDRGATFPMVVELYTNCSNPLMQALRSARSYDPNKDSGSWSPFYGDGTFGDNYLSHNKVDGAMLVCSSNDFKENDFFVFLLQCLQVGVLQSQSIEPNGSGSYPYIGIFNENLGCYCNSNVYGKNVSIPDLNNFTFESVTDNIFKIKHTKSGKYLNTEGGKLQVSDIGEWWQSAWWVFEEAKKAINNKAGYPYSYLISNHYDKNYLKYDSMKSHCLECTSLDDESNTDFQWLINDKFKG
ncbi:MAG: RICIN domain-containing protein [Bacteroidia bacterium]